MTAMLNLAACGGTARPNTYLYVGEAVVPPPDINQEPTGSVAQFKMESNGTLTALNASISSSAVPFYDLAVSPSNQFLFIPNGVTSEFVIGNSGSLTPVSDPSAVGSSVAFTPNGQFAIISDPWGATLASYSLNLDGTLAPVSTVMTGGSPAYVVVDGTGQFAYVADTNRDQVLEYTIALNGALIPNGSISSSGYNPLDLVVSATGFLYCANENSHSVTQFSINPSNGVLTFVNTFQAGSPPQGGPLWISFDPAGANAYVGITGEVLQFTVDGDSGGLTSNGTMPVPNLALWGAVDPSGKFLFTAGVIDGTVYQFMISSTGALIPNGSISLGSNIVAETLAFAQR